MNKTFALVLTCAVSVLGLTSCNNKEADVLKSNDKTHTVVFQAQNPAASETKTALQLNVVPDWRETDPNDVHIFETETIGETVTTTEATRVTMDVNEDYSDARFTAEFENAEVIADPQETKAASSSTFQYTAIMATRVDDKYVVPSVQYPNEDTWIDPKADMLVGRNQNTYSETLHEKEVDLHFERPVSLARLAITNLEGTKVNMVKLTTANNITGYLTYNVINFDKKEQTFQSDDSNKELTIVYPTGRKMASTFYAYFVSVPGEIQFSKIEVYTDQFVFTKTYATPAKLTLRAGRFMNIALDMTPGKNGVECTGLKEQTLSFVDATNQQPVPEVKYDLSSADPFTAPTLVIGDNVQYPDDVVISSSNEKVAIVTDGVVSLVGATGEATITATVHGDDTYAAGTASYKITVTNSTPKTEQEIAFKQDAVDYDLYGGTGKLTLPEWAENKDPKTTVTYASNSEVITVDETSGEVTIVATAKAGDTAVITATAAEDDTYLSATATCTITIVDTTPAGTDVTIKLEPATELVAGNEYILVSNGKALVRNNETVAAADFDATNVSVTVPAELAENVAWTLGTNTDSNNRGNIYDFANGGYFFGAAMNTQPSTYTYEIGLSQNKTISQYISIQNNNIDLSTGYVYYKGNSSSQYIYYNTDSQAWSLDKQSNGTFPAGCKTNLYVILDERAEQNLQFSAAEAEYDLYTKNWTKAVPSLSGAETTVTYESSNEAVATVNSNGDVTIASTAKNGDTATITATAAATTAFKKGSASYTITIVDSNPDVPTFTKVTSNADVEDDAQYILVYESSSKAFKPILNGSIFTKSTANAIGVTIVNNTISSSDLNDCLITFEEGKYLWIESAGKYLYSGASGDNALGAEDKTASHTVSITVDNNGIATVAHSDDTKYHLYWSSSNYFSGIYQSGSASGSQYDANICIYKLEDGRQARSIEFSATSAEIDLANTSAFVKPTLTVGGDATTVTYTSSDTATAEVDNDGNITAKKKGEVTITAKAARTDAYKAASTSYKLTVVNTDEKPVTYYKASKIVAGTQYLIVSNNTALVNNSGSAGAASVTISENQIQIVADEAMLWTAEVDGEKFNFSNNGIYLRRNSSNTGNIGIGEKSSTARNNQWSYNSSSEYLTVQTGSSTSNIGYIGYSSSSWSIGSTAVKTALYSTTPPPAPSTYTLITETSELVSGGTYLIVSSDANNYNGKDHGTLFAGDQAGTAVDVTATNGVITGAYADYEFVITASGSDYTLLGPNGYVTGNSGTSYSRYIQVSSSAVTMSMNRADEVKQENDDGQVADAFYFYYLKDSDKEALYLNSDGKYKIGGSGRNIGVYLYKKN